MTKSKSPATEPGGQLRIGAVEKLSGVPASTIRIWERRYQTLSPSRSEHGGRLYSPADVERLALLRELVEAGHAIGTIATLDSDELRARLRARPSPASAGTPCRTAVIGKALSERLRPHLASVPQLQIMGHFESLDGSRLLAPGSADAILVEVPAMQAAEVSRLLALLDSLQPRLMIVVYGFASQANLRRLDDERVLAVRSPTEPLSLLRLCLLAMNLEARGRAASTTAIEQCLSDKPPERLYGAEQLASFASLPSTVRCECPRHLADLLGSLAAFEEYSAQCENRNAEDASLHAMLRRASGNARAVLELALQRVLRAEGQAGA